MGLIYFFKEFNVKETLTCGMLALETKQSGGKQLPHSNLGRGDVYRGNIVQDSKRDENRSVERLESLEGSVPYGSREGISEV